VTDHPGIEAFDAIRGKITPNQNAAIPERRPATEEISGLIERVTFHNDESGFCVLRVKARGQREETTVVGSLPSVTAGEWLSAEGWWVRDKEHGLQFKATTMKTVPLTTTEGIEQYLGSGLVKGTGPILAKKLVGCPNRLGSAGFRRLSVGLSGRPTSFRSRL